MEDYLRVMRTIALGCVLLLFVGCDTIGGRTVILRLAPPALQPQAGLSASGPEVQQALQFIDTIMVPEGVTRAANPPAPAEQRLVARYVGGPLMHWCACSVVFSDDQLFVDFRNTHFGSRHLDTEAVERVSDMLAEKLRAQYGAKRVRVVEH
jgi:hypothetical protein